MGRQGLLAVEWRLGTLERELACGYGKNGILTSFAYSGAMQSYAYDEKGRLVRAGSFTINREAENGLAISVTDSNMQLSRQYNEYGELDAKEWSVAGLPAAWWSLGRDAAGRIVHKAEAAGGRVVNYAYGYDAAGRLSQVKKDGTIVEEYRYNGNGARVFELNRLAGIAGRTYRYDEEGRLIAAGDMRFAYDPDGFLTQKTDNAGETKYAYALRGGLLRVDISGGTVVEYVNDPFGRRIAKKVNGNVVEKYLWQGQTRLLALCDGWNNLLCRFVYADGRTPAAMEQGGRIFYLSYDQVGSLRQVTDSSGRAVKVLEYDSFGNIIKDSAPGFFLPIGFAGGLWDTHTGLVRFGYRDYYCQIGRWTAKDPIGFAAGDVDLFGYVGNDPINFVDLLGLEGAGIVFSAGAHSAISLLPLAAGVNVSSVLLNPLSSSRRLEGRGITPEAVGGIYAGLGVSIGVDDFGDTGSQAGQTIAFGKGRYMGFQVTLRREFDSNYKWFNPLRYAGGIIAGLGLAIGAPVSVTMPINASAANAPFRGEEN